MRHSQSRFDFTLLKRNENTSQKKMIGDVRVLSGVDNVSVSENLTLFLVYHFSGAKKRQYLHRMLCHPKANQDSSRSQPQRFDAHLLPPELFHVLRKHLLFILEPSSIQEILTTNFIQHLHLSS